MNWSLDVHYLAVRSNVAKSTICDIKKNKDKILRYVSRTGRGPRTKKTMLEAEFSDVEDALYAWFLQQRARHAPISEAIILQNARHFFCRNELWRKRHF